MTVGSVTFSVPGMTCGHCRSAVETEVRKVIGVESVDVDLDSKHVRIVGADLDRAVLVTAIDEAGFDVADV